MVPFEDFSIVFPYMEWAWVQAWCLIDSWGCHFACLYWRVRQCVFAKCGYCCGMRV